MTDTKRPFKTYRSPDAWDIDHPDFVIRVWIGEFVQVVPMEGKQPGDEVAVIIERLQRSYLRKHPGNPKGHDWYVVSRKDSPEVGDAKIVAGPFDSWQGAAAAYRILDAIVGVSE